MEFESPEDIYRLPSEVLERYHRQFDAIDGNKDGVITIRELVIASRAFGNKLSAFEFKEIFGKQDADDAGLITFEEFVIGYVKRQQALQQLAPLRGKFRYYDKKHRGFITHVELYERLNTDLGLNMDKCEMLMYMFDKDKDYRISLKEFGPLNTLLESMKKEVTAAFKQLDKDKDNFISRAEFKKNGFTDQQVDNIFKKYDTDGDDKLSYPEFAAFYDIPLKGQP